MKFRVFTPELHWIQQGSGMLHKFSRTKWKQESWSWKNWCCIGVLQRQSFTNSLLEGTEEILVCEKKWKCQRFCAPLTEVKPFVKESEEAPLERILCCFTDALVVFSVSSCSSLWPSLAPKVTQFSHYFIASSRTKLVISSCAWFSFFSCGSNPREVNFSAPAIPEDFLIKPWPKSSCWQLCINTSWQMLEFWEGSALDIPYLPMVPKYK